MYKQRFNIQLQNGNEYTFNMFTPNINVHRDSVVAYFAKNVYKEKLEEKEIVSLFRVVEQFEPIE